MGFETSLALARNGFDTYALYPIGDRMFHSQGQGISLLSVSCGKFIKICIRQMGVTCQRISFFHDIKAEESSPQKFRKGL